MDSLWDRFNQTFVRSPEPLGISVDISRVRFGEEFFGEMAERARGAFGAMKALEAGEVANPDEKRMVGHYWLRAAELAPTPELRAAIAETGANIEAFAAEIHAAGKFTELLIIGIGGSALGPQFVGEALWSSKHPMTPHYLDNTDPDGFDRVLETLAGKLDRTLVVVISKSGGTKETRNGMLETENAFRKAGLHFPDHAVAVTGEGSELDKVAAQAQWRRRFPMWDWVGGRTSVMSAVGLLPLRLQGIDTRQFLAGAAAMDAWTRTEDEEKNPAMLLALAWHFEGKGRGAKDMVVLPYKDRLMLFSKYLQQLVMESLGKELDLDGKKVNQGIAVYGNKGSTDQHAYVQQLRDGLNNFFVTFIEVRRDRSSPGFLVEQGATSGDYLQGFLRGTRAALYESGRDSITVSLPEVSAFSVGALIALYERAVGFYASLVRVNAYHQPGVEAGKKAATAVLTLQGRVRQALSEGSGRACTAGEIAGALREDAEAVYHVLRHMAANDSAVREMLKAQPAEDTFEVQ